MSEAAINNAYDATGIFLQNKEDRLKYINREMALMDYRSGLAGAAERGEVRGMDRLSQLISKLHEEGRDAEIFRVTSDTALRDRLFQEFRL